MTLFFKVSGSGNDFLALPEPAATPPAERIRAWCRRGVSLGADGLFALRRDGGELAMEYWNADGLPADLCLNGTRCAAQLAFHLGWAEGGAIVRTGAGRFAARRLDNARVALEVPVPAAPPAEVRVEVEGSKWRGWRIDFGVPHLVLLWPGELEGAPVVGLGRPLRHHPAFAPAGTNVNFVRFPAPGRMEIRTYERGVEDETLSCGTGVLAGAAVGLAAGIAVLPLAVSTRGGFELEVAAAESAEGQTAPGGQPGPRRWTLAGDARIVARGELLPGAEAARTGGEEPARPAAVKIEKALAPGSAPGVVEERTFEGPRQLQKLLSEAQLAASHAEARRLVQAGAVSIDGERADDPFVELPPRHGPYLVRVGKRRLASLRLR
jgi:diaminopimelate epimerase